MDSYQAKWSSVWASYEKALEPYASDGLDLKEVFEALGRARSREGAIRAALELMDEATYAKALVAMWEKDLELCDYERTQLEPGARVDYWTTRPPTWQEIQMEWLEEHADGLIDFAMEAIEAARSTRRLARLLTCIRNMYLVDGAEFLEEL
jgi:hypothetical protein